MELEAILYCIKLVGLGKPSHCMQKVPLFVYNRLMLNLYVVIENLIDCSILEVESGCHSNLCTSGSEGPVEVVDHSETF